MNIRSLAVVLVLAASPAFSAEKAPAMPAGYRAMALPFPSHQLVFIEPGDRIDIMVTFSAVMGEKAKTRKEEVTATIMQNVVVSAVNRAEGVVQLLFNPNERPVRRQGQDPLAEQARSGRHGDASDGDGERP